MRERGRGTSEGQSGGRERVKGDRQPANLTRPSRDFLVTPVASASLSLIPLLPLFLFFFLSLPLLVSPFLLAFPFLVRACLLSFGNVCTLKSRVVNDWLHKLSFRTGGESSSIILICGFFALCFFFASIFFVVLGGGGMKGGVYRDRKTRCND